MPLRNIMVLGVKQNARFQVTILDLEQQEKNKHLPKSEKKKASATFSLVNHKDHTLEEVKKELIEGVSK